MPRKPRGLFQWIWRATTGKVNGKALPWSRTRIWFLWTMGLSVFFVGVSALNLDDFPIVTSDEGWVMSTPYKLTTQGIFGTDLFAGFFDAEPRTIVMPVHYLLVALSFKLVGPGVAQARWVSLLFGVSILWFVGWLAYRWYGLAVALLTQGLLLFWRSVLMAYSPGIPLLVISRTARYDVGALAWIWATLFLLNKIVQQPDKRVAFALGLCAAQVCFILN